MTFEKQLLTVELVPCVHCHGIRWCECAERKRDVTARIAPRAYAVARGEGCFNDERPLGKRMNNLALLASIFGVQALELPKEIDRISHRLAHQEYRYDFSIRFRNNACESTTKDAYESFDDFCVVATLVDEIDVCEFLTYKEDGWKVPIFGGPLFNVWHPDCVGRGFCEVVFKK